MTAPEYPFHRLSELEVAMRRIAAIKPDAIQWVESNHVRLWNAVNIAREALNTEDKA